MKRNKPVIGITTDYTDKYYGIEKTYSLAIARHGGLPILIPSLKNNKRVLKELINNIDGLLIPGSRDMDPKYYNQKPHSSLNPMSKERTASEYIIVEQSLKNNIPIFGICGGMQFINVFFGGTLYQDIGSLLPRALNHEKGSGHTVKILNGTNLRKIVKKSRLKVHSYHHQAIEKFSKELKISAKSDDDIIEGLESQDGLVLAVQWHPELENNQTSTSLFNHFIHKSAQNLN
jgi:putative glutamine amidotransferase